MSKVMLLVEIDEGDYGDFCDWFESVPSSVAGLPCIKGKFNTALYDAKPYNPTGYCISRNVLDEIRQLYKEYQPNLATEVIEFGDALEKLIDNAPTVDAIVNTIEVRPQGEWYYSIDKGWECNQCHEIVKDMPTCMRKALYNFCPNCGAELRKGGAK